MFGSNEQSRLKLGAHHSSDIFQSLIEKQKRRGLYVFSRPDGRPIGSIQKVWETARRRAKFHDLRVHDLRHTVASLALQQGVSLSIVGKMPVDQI
jgi:integrase